MWPPPSLNASTFTSRRRAKGKRRRSTKDSSPSLTGCSTDALPTDSTNRLVDCACALYDYFRLSFPLLNSFFLFLFLSLFLSLSFIAQSFYVQNLFSSEGVRACKGLGWVRLRLGLGFGLRLGLVLMLGLGLRLGLGVVRVSLG